MRISDREQELGLHVISQPRLRSDSPKIVSIITRMNAGGPAVHVCVLAEALEKRGYQNLLIAGVCEDQQGDLPADVPAELNIATVPWLSRSISPVRDLAALWAVYRLIRRAKPSIVHTHTAKAGFIGRQAALAVRPRPAIVHTYHGHVLEGYFSPLMTRIFIGIERMLARVSDRIVAISPAIERELRDFPVAQLRRMPVQRAQGSHVGHGLDIECEYGRHGNSRAQSERERIPETTPHSITRAGRSCGATTAASILRNGMERSRRAHVG